MGCWSMCCPPNQSDFKLNSFLSKIGRSPIGQLNSDGGAGIGCGHGLSAAGRDVLRIARLLGGPVSGRQGKRRVHGSWHARRCGAGYVGQGQLAPRSPRPSPASRGCGPGPGWMRCWKRSSARAKTRPPSMKSSAWPGSTNSSRPIPLFLRCPARCCGPASFVPEIPCYGSRRTSPFHPSPRCFLSAWCRSCAISLGEDVWQTRFLAPDDMQDGTYTVRLILRDRSGHAYRESKTFVIASKPPVVQIKLDTRRYHRGQTINLKARASQSTRTLVARMEGVLPVALNWDARAGINYGTASHSRADRARDATN